MSKLIFLPGNLSSAFVVNELNFLKNEFDEVFIFPFDEGTKTKEIADKFQLQYRVNHKISLRSIFSMEFFKWVRSSNVIEEIKENCSVSYQGLCRLLYILYYGIFMLDNYREIEKEINNYSGDVVLYSYWLSRPAFLIAQFKGFKNVKYSISRAHRFDIYFNRNNVNYLPFRKYLDSNLNQISFISNHGKEFFDRFISSKYSGTEKSKKTIAYLGSFNDEDRRKGIIKKDVIVIASCSATIGIKRIDLIIKIISRLNGINIRWIHVGNGELQDDMKKLAKLKLKNGQYKFLGYIENQDILKIYSKYDVDFFINMSDSEGIPVSIMEAMSMGIPVIARDIGGISEIVNNNNGLLINSNAGTDKIKEFIKNRLDNIIKYKKYSENAREFWKNNFNASSAYHVFFHNLNISDAKHNLQ